MAITKSILLIHPPVVKPSEPPAGIARLAGVLRKHSVSCRIWDANIGALIDILQTPIEAGDTWTRRAAANLGENIASVRSRKIYAGNRDRYKRAVMDINRVLRMAGRFHGKNISLSDYGDPGLSPLVARDLVEAARRYHENPFYRYFRDGLTDLLSLSGDDIIGFSVNFMSQALCAFAMAGWIRKHSPRVRIVFGGGLVSSWMQIPGFGNPFEDVVDDLVAGPGEAVLLKMAGVNTEQVTDDSLYDFTGLDADNYLAPGFILPISSSRGCYWRKCSFCPETAEKSRYTQIDPAAVMNAVRTVSAEKKPVLIHFLDNALSPRFMKHLVKNPPGVPWYGFARITRHLADPDFVRGLKLSGCAMLKTGIESGDQAVLDSLDKGIDLKIVSKALSVLSSAGIPVYAYLLFGTPAENRERARRTKSFICSHAQFIDYLNLAIFNLPANCRQSGELETGSFYEGDLTLYRRFVHPGGWDRKAVRVFLEKEFKSEPSIREIVNRNPPFFTSNHAPLFS